MKLSRNVSVSRITPTIQLNSRGGLVRARVEHAHHVQEDRDDHAVRRVPVQVPQQQAERDDRLEVLHVLVRHRRGRAVVEHQQDAGHRQQQEQEEREAAEAERVGDLQALTSNPHRVQVQKDVVEHDQRLVPRGARIPGAEDALEDSVLGQRSTKIPLAEIVEKWTHLLHVDAAPRYVGGSTCGARGGDRGSPVGTPGRDSAEDVRGSAMFARGSSESRASNVLIDSVAAGAGKDQALPGSPARIVPSPPEGVNERLCGRGSRSEDRQRCAGVVQPQGTRRGGHRRLARPRAGDRARARRGRRSGRRDRPAPGVARAGRGGAAGGRDRGQCARLRRRGSGAGRGAGAGRPRTARPGRHPGQRGRHQLGRPGPGDAGSTAGARSWT